MPGEGGVQPDGVGVQGQVGPEAPPEVAVPVGHGTRPEGPRADPVGAQDGPRLGSSGLPVVDRGSSRLLFSSLLLFLFSTDGSSTGFGSVHNCLPGK